MCAAKPCLGYPSRTAAILALQAEGVSRSEICQRIGISPAMVSTLAREGKATRARRPAETNGRTVLFPVDILERLRPHAVRRGITPNELVRRLIDTIADDDMVDAILDDEDTN